MDGSKPWYASAGIWGAVIAVAAGLGGIWGWTLAPADQAHLIDALSTIGAVIGGLIAGHGRVTATQKIAGGTK